MTGSPWGQGHAISLPRDHPRRSEAWTRAFELTQSKEPRRLATLAAAQAEAGDFGAAVKWQETALERVDGSDPARREYLKTLARSKAKKPFYRLGLLEEWGL